jgi:hypothetical protein
LIIDAPQVFRDDVRQNRRNRCTASEDAAIRALISKVTLHARDP